MAKRSLQHLAIIMDGNRRYAKHNKLLPWLGHKKGIDAVQQTIEFCIENNIKYLSLYTFSLENFNRTPRELSFLFSLLVDGIKEHQASLIKNGVCMQFVGDRSQFPTSAAKTCQELENNTKHLEELYLQALFCYGGQQEIVAAAKNLANDIQSGQLAAESVNTQTFKKYLWTPASPDPDLIIRTGGMKRLSNFLLYQAAYTELYFTDTLWPAIDKKELAKAMDYFMNVQQNCGF